MQVPIHLVYGSERRTSQALEAQSLIRRLTIGGAERQLVELATGLDPNIFDVTVLCFYGAANSLKSWPRRIYR